MCTFTQNNDNFDITLLNLQDAALKEFDTRIYYINNKLFKWYE